MLLQSLPVIIDLETRSTCDLKARGGWNYAKDKNTSLLTVSWSNMADPEEIYHLWLPTVDEFDRDYLKPPSDQLLRIHLPEVRVYYGPDVPDELASTVQQPWVAHNAWSFDQLVWEAVQPTVTPKDWIDTYPLALAAGLPGGLNDIGKRLWGDGKYEEGSRVAKEATRAKNADDADPRNVPVGQLVQVGRYNVQDVRLLRWLWKELQDSLVLPDWEWEVLALHRRINARGVQVDMNLAGALSKLSIEARKHAVEEIAELTGGRLASLEDLRKRTKVFAWLEENGVDLGKDPSLRKEIIQRYIEKNDKPVGDDSEQLHADTEEPEENVVHTNLPKALKVLELRMSALRITDAKLEAAGYSICSDSRVRMLFAYWAAHTGRWAGRRIQVHNLPRPKEGVDVWKAVKLFDEFGELPYAAIRELVNAVERTEQTRFLSVDDYSSALIRLMFTGVGDVPLAAADLANIEARVLAWLAGETWLMRAFWEDTDPYMAMAERIFGKRDTWDMTGVKSLKKHPFRQVGKVVELGSGYGLGLSKFSIYAASNGIDLSKVGVTPKECIEGYRSSHPAIAGQEAGEYKGRKYYKGGFWDQLNEAAIKAVLNNTETVVGKIRFEKHRGNLLVHLPSERRLVYRNVRAGMVTPSYAKGTDKLVMSVQYASPRFGLNTMYGGKWAENVTQAVARDFLAHGLSNVERRGMPVVLHVHDEGVAETGDLDGFMSAITELPPWAPDFPLDAEGSLLPRYSKSPPPGVSEVVYRNGKRLK